MRGPDDPRVEELRELYSFALKRQTELEQEVHRLRGALTATEASGEGER